MTINTQKLRDLIRRAAPLPWTLATSNSWRRIVDPYHVPVCSPCTQSDGHPDLAFPGGPEGPTAQLLIEAANALPGLLDIFDAANEQVAEYARIAEQTRAEADARIDAQAAEIAEAKGQIEHLDRQNTGLLAQHDRDSKTLREYAQARDGLRWACAALEAEKARLRYALRWTSAALQEACRRPTIITEKDRWRIDHEVRTTGEILASSDATLSGESK